MAIRFDDIPLDEARRMTRSTHPVPIRHTFGWAPGYRPKVEADIVGQRILALKRDYLDEDLPEAMVEDARPDDSPMHPAFEWDDPTAAHEFRLDQARAMIRCCFVVKASDQGEPEPQKLILHVNMPANAATGEPARSGYMFADDVMKESPTRERLVERAIQELRSWCHKYRDLDELKAIRDRIISLLNPPRHGRRNGH